MSQLPLALTMNGEAIRAPMVVSYGMGVDSTAMLLGLEQRGERPDRILFANTGGEKPETYAYEKTIGAWLESVGFPMLTTSSYRPTNAPYSTLEGNCAANETLPSLAFGRSGCSNKFKSEVMDAFLLGKKRGPWSGEGWDKLYLAKAVGLKTLKCIGYDNGRADLRRAARVAGRDDPNFEYRYPLQEWEWTREECVAEIEKAGLPVPIKSACYFCPASHRCEIRWLAAQHPSLFLQAVAMEDAAANGKHGLNEGRGLGIGFRWRDFAESEGFLKGGEMVGDPAELLQKVSAEIPAFEANSLVQLVHSRAA